MLNNFIYFVILRQIEKKKEREKSIFSKNNSKSLNKLFHIMKKAYKQKLFFIFTIIQKF